jgi:D-3-phosphoglycerate dehydrogenase
VKFPIGHTRRAHIQPGFKAKKHVREGRLQPGSKGFYNQAGANVLRASQTKQGTIVRPLTEWTTFCMTYRILITDDLAEPGKAILCEQAELVEASPNAVTGAIDAMIVRSATEVTAEIIEANRPTLRVIGRAGVGVDNIDLDAARRLSVVVVNAPEAASIAVAEHTLGLMLAMARNIPKAAESLRKGRWLKPQLQGIELKGKTLGIIGVGRIGSEVLKRAEAFGMQVLGYDTPDQMTRLEKQGVSAATLDELLKQSDFISVHVPLQEDTHRLIDQAALSKVKRGAYLICTARGGVVDEQALLESLRRGRLAGAALDVFEHEPPGKTALLEHPNLVGTPHIGAQTYETQQQAARDIAEEVLAALNNKPLRWQVT